MTHPYREELAGRLPGSLSERLEAIASALSGSGLWGQSVSTLREAAAALRQSPTVEEVARVIDPAAFLFTPAELGVKDYHHPARVALDKARAVDRLYRGSKE